MCTLYSPASLSELGAEGAATPSDFGRSVNPVQIREGRLCPPHYFLSSRIFRPSYGPVLRSWKQALDRALQLSNMIRLISHCLFRFLDGKKIPASNLAFQAFEGFIGT